MHDGGTSEGRNGPTADVPATGDRAGEDGREPTPRVLAWAGPGSWRDARPRLVARTLRPSVRGDAGFSMVELMVALLVVAILLAIAIPTFLGTTGAADDRSAQTNLSTALTDAKAQFQSAGQTYDVGGAADPQALAQSLDAAQLSLSFRAGSLGTSTALGSSGSASTISVAVSSDGEGIVLAAFSVPGNCFYVVDNATVLSGAVAATNPYQGTTPVTTTPHAVTGTIGLPTAAGTSLVTVSGDHVKADCNAFTPQASVAGASVSYGIEGFPAT